MSNVTSFQAVKTIRVVKTLHREIPRLSSTTELPARIKQQDCKWILAHQGKKLLALVCCCNGTVQVKRGGVSIPVPSRAAALTIDVGRGEQRVQSFDNNCSSLEVDESAWLHLLSASGFLVDAGPVMETRIGPVFAIRFRRGMVIADLVSEPGPRLVCRTYKIRVQVSRDGAPSPWLTPFILAGLWRMMDSTEAPRGSYFSANAAFPTY